jgi:hypothetical protein
MCGMLSLLAWQMALPVFKGLTDASFFFSFEPAGNLRACLLIVSWVEPVGIRLSRLALV